MILRRIAQTFFWVIEVCGIFFVSASIVLLFLLCLAKLRSGTWPDYNLSMLWRDLHFSPWNDAQKIIDSAITTIPQLPAWVAILIVGGLAFAVGRFGYAVVDAYVQLFKNRCPDA